MSKPFLRFSILTALLVLPWLSTQAVNVLVNGSFEDSVIINSGNNLNVIVPNWAITDSTIINPNPTNVVNPFVGYTGGPDAAQDGAVYFDGNGTDVMLFQDFNIVYGQTVSYSGYFSRRDNFAANGNSLKIYDSTGTILLSESNIVDIPSSASQEDWYLSSNSVFLPAGDYRLQVALQNDANLDNVIVNAIPEPSVMGLLGSSALGLLIYRSMKKRSAAQVA